jgi:hypothetical protein
LTSKINNVLLSTTDALSIYIMDLWQNLNLELAEKLAIKYSSNSIEPTNPI